MKNIIFHQESIKYGFLQSGQYFETGNIFKRSALNYIIKSDLALGITADRVINTYQDVGNDEKNIKYSDNYLPRCMR